MDVIGLALAIQLGYLLHNEQFAINDTNTILSSLLLIAIAIPVFIKQGMYRAILSSVERKYAFTVMSAVSLVFAFWLIALLILQLPFSFSVVIITWLLAMFYAALTRMLSIWLLVTPLNQKGKPRKKVAIYGAGKAGKQLVGVLKKMDFLHVVAFIDDDSQLQDHEVASIKVYAPSQLEMLLNDKGVTEVYFAIPSISADKRHEIIQWLETFTLNIYTLPPISEIVSGKIGLQNIHKVEITDLLDREPVKPDPQLLSKCITGKVVMITGAGGSIGSEICKKVLMQKPKTLILLELSEYALYKVEQALNQLPISSETKLIPLLGNVLDQQKVEFLLQKFSVQTIYHAAAYKHVPIVEQNIKEGLTNNSLATQRLAELAAKNKVDHFVLVSTDKAVRPTNVMGASKRLAELALQGLQKESKHTKFIIVRFGNVLGSSGSVIPLFKKQIETGGPVTVTHPDITRYFMTIPEAASLVIQAGAMGQGGEVFILSMGEPVKISDLAKKMITLSGRQVQTPETPDGIAITYTGLRPGEKLYEELVIGDNVTSTLHPRIMQAKEQCLSYQELKSNLNELELKLVEHQYTEVLLIISELVSGYKTSESWEDVFYDSTVVK